MLDVSEFLRDIEQELPSNNSLLEKRISNLERKIGIRESSNDWPDDGYEFELGDEVIIHDTGDRGKIVSFHKSGSPIVKIGSKTFPIDASELEPADADMTHRNW